MRLPTIFVSSLISARAASRARFWTLPDSLGGGFWPPQMAETSLEIRLGPPESRSRLLFFGSKRGKIGFPKGAKKGTPNGTPKCQARGNARSPSLP